MSAIVTLCLCGLHRARKFPITDIKAGAQVFPASRVGNMDPKLSQSLAKFAFDFCNNLEKNETSVCSPLSVQLALALTALGCRGQSHDELLKAMGIPDDKAIRSSFASLTSTLRGIKSVTLNIANKLYIKKGGELKPAFKKDAKKVFKATPEQLDFNKKDAAARIINDWVAKKTNQLIKEVVSAEQLNDLIRIVVVNVIYFKGNWKVPFIPQFTRNRKFHVNNITTVYVPMMYKSETDFKYGEFPQLKAKILSMDYKGDEASMVFVLPDDIEGLSSTLQQLANGHDLMADIKALRLKETNVMIPKFKAEMTINLKNLLPKMGIKSIFNESLSEIDMLSNEKLFVSEAIQKALIIVDETGTEASASFHDFCQLLRGKPPPKRFFADRPFLYVLLARSVPVFVGVYEGSQYAVPSS